MAELAGEKIGEGGAAIDDIGLNDREHGIAGLVGSAGM
jgi:hypothetical protein